MEVTFSVLRHMTPNESDFLGQKRLHAERARLLHALVDTLDLNVEDWGKTDSATPREWVELILALGTAKVFASLVSIVQLWLEQDKIAEVRLKGPSGIEIVLKNATAKDVIEIAHAIGLRFEN